jgi:hypothetical protein
MLNSRTHILAVTAGESHLAARAGALNGLTATMMA